MSKPISNIGAALMTGLLITLSGCTSGVGPQLTAPLGADGWVTLFDGSSADGWTMAGPGSMALQPDGTLLTEGGMGLFYYEDAQFTDFILELEWKVESPSTNSGVFVRFPKTDDPWVAVNQGYEIQIAEEGPDEMHTTGSVYSFSAPFRSTAYSVGTWNRYVIQVIGQRYEIFLNGEKINDFFGDRSLAGHIGLQNHDADSKAWFRNIKVKPLNLEGSNGSIAELMASSSTDTVDVLMVTATHGFRHGPAIEASRKVMEEIGTTTEIRVTMTEDIEDLNDSYLADFDVLFFANSTLKAEKPSSTSEDTAAGTEEGPKGDFANYAFTLATGQADLPGIIELSGSADDLSGTITFEAFGTPSDLSNVDLSGDKMSFFFMQDVLGEVTGNVILEGDGFAGSLMVMGNALVIEGAAPGGESASAEAMTDVWRTYDVELVSPPMHAEVILKGEPSSLSGTIEFRENPGANPLNDVTLDGESLSFTFEGGEFGTISVQATLSGTDWDGDVTVGGNTMNFDGQQSMDDKADDPDAPRVSVAQQDAVLSFLRAGKGVVLAHSGLDAFYNWDGYRDMVGGGLFDSHPWTQSVRVSIEETDNPAVSHMGDGFYIRDEIYVLDENPRWNAKVLASLDMSTVEQPDGAAGKLANDHPISWIRNHNGGRVFVTKLGHFPDVWTTPDFLKHVLQGIRMAAGTVEADFSGHRVKETVAENVWPDDIAIDERGNVWIAELRGKIHLFDAALGQTTLVGEVPTTDPTKIEHGLLGIEVDPEFYSGKPWIYAFYTERETFINTLYRYEFKEGAIDLASEKVLLRVPTEPQCCHQAGDLEWGPDSTLYISTGDTGMSEVRPDWKLSESRLEAFKTRHGLDDIHWSRLVDSERSAQNLQDLRGKILRINRDGSIPRDNPFFGDPGVRWEIYAYGLRNPYRFKVDQETSALYIGVVGPDASYDYDEYNISVKGGENFGWPRTIGKLFYNEWTPSDIDGFVPPIWEYTYKDGGRSATVGPMYRHEGPGAFPPYLQDKVFVFDWARRWIKYGTLTPARFTNDEEADVRVEPLSVNVGASRLVDIRTFDILTNTAPISMELSPDGSIYVAEFDGFWDAGPNSNVSRYRWVTGNSEPIGKAQYKEVLGDPRTIQFDGSDLYDPDADSIQIRWEFGDGNGSLERSPVHRYQAAGTYVATVEVTDEHGLSADPQRLSVVVNALPEMKSTSAAEGAGGKE